MIMSVIAHSNNRNDRRRVGGMVDRAKKAGNDCTVNNLYKSGEILYWETGQSQVNE